MIELVSTLGNALGPTVIIAVGYNDFEPAYAGDIEDALAVLRKAGVTHVLWLTLHEARPSYASMNDAIHAAALRHPELTVVDWQLYSRSHPDWFQDDGIHLQADGAVAMATLIHNTLAALAIPAAATPVQTVKAFSILTSRLTGGVVGRPYSARLVARGGTGPLRWTRVSGLLPRGLQLRLDGRISGVPTDSGTFTAQIRVVDARGTRATHTITLTVRNAPGSS